MFHEGDAGMNTCLARPLPLRPHPCELAEICYGHACLDAGGCSVAKSNTHRDPCVKFGASRSARTRRTSKTTFTTPAGLHSLKERHE